MQYFVHLLIDELYDHSIYQAFLF